MASNFRSSLWSVLIMSHHPLVKRYSTALCYMSALLWCAMMLQETIFCAQRKTMSPRCWNPAVVKFTTPLTFYTLTPLSTYCSAIWKEKGFNKQYCFKHICYMILQIHEWVHVSDAYPIWLYIFLVLPLILPSARNVSLFDQPRQFCFPLLGSHLVFKNIRLWIVELTI